MVSVLQRFSWLNSDMRVTYLLISYKVLSIIIPLFWKWIQNTYADFIHQVFRSMYKMNTEMQEIDMIVNTKYISINIDIIN